MSSAPSDLAADPSSLGGFIESLGLKVTSVTQEKVVATWDVAPSHLQPHGIVHGGVHCGVVETVCSIGAGLIAAERGQIVVGVDNHTNFVRPVRSGRLTATGTPISVGRRMQIWQAHIRDSSDKLVAQGQVRLFCTSGEGKDRPPPT